MDMLKKLFPSSFKTNTIQSLITTILVYVIADVLCGFVVSFLGAIPLIGLVFSLIGWVLGLYFLVAIILAVLNYMKVLK